MPEYVVHLRTPHPKQAEFINSTAKRKIIRAGRRGGKTTGIAILACEAFLTGRRVLYAAPTSDQVGKFWTEVVNAFYDLIQNKILIKNETEHTLEWANQPRNEARIRAKTAWNADTLRGDYADLLILDEYQLMAEDAWGVVGAPMLVDNNGDAVFIYTPPSIRSSGISKARDKKHAPKLFKRAEKDTRGRWAVFHFTSFENPHISKEALDDLTEDMSSVAYRQEMLADDDIEVIGALWKWDNIDRYRVNAVPDKLVRIVVAIDPAISANEGSDETGIIVCGKDGNGHGYVLQDASGIYTPNQWAKKSVTLYEDWKADAIVAEVNQGGDMVENTIHTVDPRANVIQVRATKGKLVRAEPIAALAEKGFIHHVGIFPLLEEQLCGWVQGDESPDRLDANVWGFADLMLGLPRELQGREENPFYQ